MNFYSDYKSTFLEKDKDTYFSGHQKITKTLAIELYKHTWALANNYVFKINRLHNVTPQNTQFFSRVSKTVEYETKAISFLAPKIWTLKNALV